MKWRHDTREIVWEKDDYPQFVCEKKVMHGTLM